LIDDSGVARLSTGGHSSIVLVPDTSIVGHVQSGGAVNNRYSAPELHWSERHGADKIPVTKESDVYGMGMVIYEASSHQPVLSAVRVKSHVHLLGLDGGQTVRQLQRYSCFVKNTRWETSPTTLRHNPWPDLGVPWGMLEQGS